MPLRVTIELVPHGREANASTLGQIVIENVAGGTDALGVYRYSLIYGNVNSSNPSDYVQASGIIYGFPRRLGHLALLRAAMERIETGTPFAQYEAAPTKQSNPL